TGMVSNVSDVPEAFGGPGGGIWVWWIFSILASLLAVALGFLAGFALLKQFVLSGEGEAADAAEAFRKKLAGIQILLGLAGMLLGLLHLIFTLVWW
ncbi:MAG: hypothetical protein KGY81_10785, partial [Phycisphaerae bacterium]|nr:hypothetical protein [Phycisphaerae bacterium]